MLKESATKYFVLAEQMFGTYKQGFLAAAAWSGAALSSTLPSKPLSTVNDSILQLGGTYYLAANSQPEYCISSNIPAAGEVLPLTKLLLNVSTIAGDDLKVLINEYIGLDDVFRDHFLRTVHISTTAPSPGLGESAVEYLASMGTQYLFVEPGWKTHVQVPTNLRIIVANASEAAISSPNGPYAASVSAAGISIAKVYRLYEDIYRTFLHGTYPNGTNSYQPLALTSSGTGVPLIP